MNLQYPVRGGFVDSRRADFNDNDRHLANQYALEDHLSKKRKWEFGAKIPEENWKTGTVTPEGHLFSDAMPFISPGELFEEGAELIGKTWGVPWYPWWHPLSGREIDWGGENQSAFMVPGDEEWIYSTAGQGGDADMNELFQALLSLGVPGLSGDEHGGFGHMLKMRVDGTDKQPVDWGTWGVAPNFHNHYINTYCGIVYLQGNRVGYRDDISGALVHAPIHDPGDRTIIDQVWISDYFEIHANPSGTAVCYIRYPNGGGPAELCVWDGENIHVIVSNAEGNPPGVNEWNDDGACMDQEYVYWSPTDWPSWPSPILLYRARYDGSERELLYTSSDVTPIGQYSQAIPMGWGPYGRFYLSFLQGYNVWPYVPALWSLDASFGDMRFEQTTGASTGNGWLGIRMGNITQSGVLLVADEHYKDPHNGWFAGIRAMAPRASNEPFLFPFRGGFDFDDDRHSFNYRAIEDRVNRGLDA